MSLGLTLFISSCASCYIEDNIPLVEAKTTVKNLLLAALPIIAVLGLLLVFLCFASGAIYPIGSPNMIIGTITSFPFLFVIGPLTYFSIAPCISCIQC